MSLIALAKKLRKNPTKAETLLWKHLRQYPFGNTKFRRQQPIGRFIPDFVSFGARIVIEVDGGQHSQGATKDLQRDKWFSEQGFQVLRFWNNEVLENTGAVLDIVHQELEKRGVGTGVNSPNDKPGTDGTDRLKFSDC